MATKEALPETEEKESIVNEDMKAVAEENLKQLNKERAEGPKLRTYSRGYKASRLAVLDLYEFPPDFEVEGIAPTSYLAQPEGEITGNVETQKFSIVESRLKGLVFDVPDRPLAQGRSLRSVKWLKPSGVLGQIPFEGQINNTAAGEMTDAVGVRKMQRKGGVVLFNFETLMPIYCFAHNCWAAAMVEGLTGRYPEHRNVVGSGYCSRNHFIFTEANRAKKWFNEGGGGMFEADVTTSQTYMKAA